MNTEDIKYTEKKMIYWNTSNRSGDRYEVWYGGVVIARHITFNECWALVESLQAKQEVYA